MQAWNFHQNELLQVKEQIFNLKKEEWARKEKLAKSDPGIAELEEELSAAYKEIKRLRYELDLRSIKEIESVPTHPESLWNLNEKYGIDVTKDEVFLLALDLVKFPHKHPSIFLTKELTNDRKMQMKIESMHSKPKEDTRRHPVSLI
jgi:hypothetical protein